MMIKGRHLKSSQLMNEMINNHVFKKKKTTLVNFSSVPGTMAKDCTWFVSESSQFVKL